MSYPNTALGEGQRAIDETIRNYWGLFLVHGVVLMILGVLAVIWPQISTVAADIYIGWLFLFGGIVGLVTMFWAPGVPGFLWSLLTAALSLIVGVNLISSGLAITMAALTGRSLVETVAGAKRDGIPWAQRSGTMSSVHHGCELREKRHTNAAISGVWKMQPKIYNRKWRVECQISW